MPIYISFGVDEKQITLQGDAEILPLFLKSLREGVETQTPATAQTQTTRRTPRVQIPVPPKPATSGERVRR